MDMDRGSNDALRFESNCVDLIRATLRLEVFVRRYFNVPIGSGTVDGVAGRPFDQERRADCFEAILTNYVYDSYVRLILAGHLDLVFTYEWIGTTCLLYSLRLSESLEKRSSSSELGARSLEELSTRLDELRRSANFDILSSTAIQVLQECAELRALEDACATGNRCDTEDRGCVDDKSCADSSDGSSSAALPTNSSVAYFNESSVLLSLKTFYDVQLDSELFDHSTHREEAFVPFFRFCGKHGCGLNMSEYIGHTMKENVQSLYEYISSVVNDATFCPCVVIFNLFVRDNYRMYHSKSLRHTSYVVIRLASGRIVRLSYMILANMFPLSTSWFKSIYNQLVKKTTKTNILHLDAYLRLIVNLRKRQAKDALDAIAKTKVHTTLEERKKSRTTKSPRPRAVRARKKLVNDGNKRANHKRKALSTSDNDVSESESNDSKNQRHGSPRSTSSSKTIRKRTERLTVSKFYTAAPETELIGNLYNTEFVCCEHKRVQRVYEQLRANDESATLIRFCMDCQQRL